MSDTPIMDEHRDIYVVRQNERTFYIVGTAHVSQESVNLVEQVIVERSPDCVCIELDEKRHEALAEQNKWEKLNLREVLKQKRLSVLLINLLLSGYQRKLGKQLGVMPGQELLAASQMAQKHNIPIALCDRDIRTTLRRAWSCMRFWEKIKLLSSGITSIFESYEISEEDLAQLRNRDTLSQLLNDLSERMPVLKRVLLDERDSYLAEKIRQCEGQTVVAVVGAGHAAGIVEHLQNDEPTNLKPLDVIPPSSPWIKRIGWGVPAIILASIGYIAATQGADAAGENAWYWFLANAIPTALGAAIACAHPLTIVAGALAAPFTSLTPIIGAGYVAAFAQAYFAPPTVKELHAVSDDAGSPRGWWHNRLLRVLLVFVGTGIGSAIGTYVGAFEIISNLSGA